MTSIKRFFTGIIALAMILSFAACGTNTKWAFRIDDIEIPAGVYIAYLNSAKSEASTLVGDSTADLSTQEIDGQNAIDWVEARAKELCIQHAAVDKEFERLELEITTAEEEYLKQYVDSHWESYSYNSNYEQVLNETIYTEQGISKDSVYNVTLNSYKYDKVFMDYYGVDGSEAVSDEEVKTFMLDTYTQVSYVRLPITSSSSEVTDEDKAALKERIDYFAEQIEAGSSVTDLGQEFADEVNATAGLTSEDSGAATASNYSADKQLIPKYGSEAAASSSYEQKFAEAVFEMAADEIKVIETDSYYYAVKKYNLADDEDTFTSSRTQFLQVMKTDEYQQKMIGIGEGLDIKQNDASIKRYKPK